MFSLRPQTVASGARMLEIMSQKKGKVTIEGCMLPIFPHLPSKLLVMQEPMPWQGSLREASLR